MTKLFDEVVEKVRKLPANKQAYAASVLVMIVAESEGVYALTDDERKEVQDGLAEIDRGDIATDEEMKALWQRAGV